MQNEAQLEPQGVFMGYRHFVFNTADLYVGDAPPTTSAVRGWGMHLPCLPNISPLYTPRIYTHALFSMHIDMQTICMLLHTELTHGMYLMWLCTECMECISCSFPPCLKTTPLCNGMDYWAQVRCKNALMWLWVS